MRDSNDIDADSYCSDSVLASECSLISLGANAPGHWGTPSATLCRSLDHLEQNGISIANCSPIYRTPPHPGAGLMPEFYNVVVAVRANIPVYTLLRRLKAIERLAGRRARPRWSARPLDLDLLDHGGRVVNWPAPTRPGGPIVLPHPLLHRRGFVLVPLADIAPRWRHPVLGVSAENLLKRTPGLGRGITRA